MSFKSRPIVCVLGASMQALAIQGFTSVSPMPVIPSSVWTKTTMSSWADEVAPVSRSGTRSTWQSMPVIFMLRYLTGCCGLHKNLGSIVVFKRWFNDSDLSRRGEHDVQLRVSHKETSVRGFHPICESRICVLDRVAEGASESPNAKTG